MNENQQLSHNNSRGESKNDPATQKRLSQFDMLVFFAPGNNCKNRTYRGDTELAQYLSYNMPGKIRYQFQNEMQALLFKLTNIFPRVTGAILYDNRNGFREVVFEIRNGVIEKNFTGEKFDVQ